MKRFTTSKHEHLQRQDEAGANDETPHVTVAVVVETAWAAVCESKSQNLAPKSKYMQVLTPFWSRHQEALVAPPTVVDAIVSIVQEVSTQTEWRKSHWVSFNAGKNPMYLMGAILRKTLQRMLALHL